jgi:DNA/RNA-binding domain of Phe-tRNA-synthetase-like protein
VFAYDPKVSERFPSIRAGVIHARGLSNGPSPQELLDEYQTGQRTVVQKLGETAIADLPSISAWRRVFAEFGAKPTRYRNAAEALLRRLSKQGGIPTVNTLVDVGNLVSIRYAMPVAVFDQANIAGGSTTVRFATGSELFTDLGSSDIVYPDPGEVIFVDSDNVVSARRWCWRQSAQSATSTTTQNALIVIEGHHDTARQDVESALTDLTSLLASHQPHGQVESYVLSPTNPRTGTSAGVENTSR